MKGSKLQIQEELLLAKQSRLEGNEGRARVCARRAAGAAAQEFLRQNYLQDQPINALESLQLLIQELELPGRIQEAIECLLQRVDQDHNLPPSVDLIVEAEQVIQYLEIGVSDNQSSES